MPDGYSSIDITQVQQLKPFKIDYSHVNDLTYVDKSNAPPQSFAAYCAAGQTGPLLVEQQTRPQFPLDLADLQTYSAAQFPRGKMLVLVNYSIYPAIKLSVDQYVLDVAYEGYYATAYRVQNGSPAQLRSFILGQGPIAGVLMVGSLPTAWYEFDQCDDFSGSNSEFPCDLYYMDAYGVWSDPDNDGRFSGPVLHPMTALWVGRLWTPTGGGNDTVLLNDYFARNHKFRRGLLGCSNRALAFVDEDWIPFGNCALDYMFAPPNIDTITDPWKTDGDRYKAELHQRRAWVHVCAHSSPYGHSFKYPGGPEWVPSTYLSDVNPPNAYFYNLFACSNTRFTQPGYMGGWYIFDKSGGSVCNGLAAVGSTKAGSMLLFENFYGPMGAGKTIGEAFVAWWRAFGSQHTLTTRRWHYGMTLLGDPTLDWRSGMVPVLRDPVDGDTFDHVPRLTRFSWDPIWLGGPPNEPVSYEIQIEEQGTGVGWSGQWAQGGSVYDVGASCMREYTFTAAGRGRWRVRAKVVGRPCPWSEWNYLRYTA